MKKIISILLVVVLLIVTSACTSNLNNDNSSYIPPSSSEDDTVDTITKDSIGDVISTKNVTCYPFSNEYAWVESNNTMYVINVNGEILASISLDSQYGNILKMGDMKGFYDGVSVVISDYGTISMDINGNIINYWNTNDKTEVLGVTENNILVIRETVETVDDTIIKIGSADFKGNWIVEPKEIGIIGREDYKIVANYKNANIFFIYNQDDYGHYADYCLFNAETGENYNTVDTDGFRNISMSCTNFSNGKCILNSYSRSGNTLIPKYIFLTESLEEIKIIDRYDEKDELCGFAHSIGDNGWYYVEKDSSIIGRDDKLEVYDDNHNLKFELLKKYPKLISVTSFKNGVSVLTVKNDNNIPFVLAIDENGNELFDPIQIPDVVTNEINNYSEGLLAIPSGTKDDIIEVKYIDKNGNVCATIPYGSKAQWFNNTFDCNNGIVTNGEHYYDKNGNILFE